MKKILSCLLCGLMLGLNLSLSSEAIEEVNNSTKIEHIKLPKKLAKKTPGNIVNVTDENYDIAQYNTLQVTFAQNFNEKTAKIGDEVAFLFKDGVSTVEGSQILPPATKLFAQITDIQKPKSFNRSGKIYLDFKYIELPSGERKPVKAQVFSKNEYLSRGKLNAMGKGFGTTFGTSAVGVAAGCGIGIAADAVIIGGFAIGLPIAFVVGGAVGLLTPGLNYKAKAGEKVNIQLVNDVKIEK